MNIATHHHPIIIAVDINFKLILLLLIKF